MPIPTVPAKILKFPELALLCLREDRRHYFACAKIGGVSEMKAKNFVFCFAFLSTCTIFADGTTKTKKQCFRFAARTIM